MIASSSVTLRARSSRSACKSWNICKLTSYQRATRGLCEGGGGVGVWRHQAESRGCSWLSPLPFPAGRYSGSVSAPTFDPCLKLTLPQASYSPWIPIIVSRIKTLSAKIFSASLIWCIPSPCEDRYSCQGKENKPGKLFAKMQDILFFFCCLGTGQPLAGLRQPTGLPSARTHSVPVFLWGPSLSPAMLLHEVNLCHAGPISISMHITHRHHDSATCLQPFVTNVSLTGGGPAQRRGWDLMSFVKVGGSDVTIRTVNASTEKKRRKADRGHAVRTSNWSVNTSISRDDFRSKEKKAKFDSYEVNISTMLTNQHRLHVAKEWSDY